MACEYTRTFESNNPILADMRTSTSRRQLESAREKALADFNRKKLKNLNLLMKETAASLKSSYEEN